MNAVCRSIAKPLNAPLMMCCDMCGADRMGAHQIEAPRVALQPSGYPLGHASPLMAPVTPDKVPTLFAQSPSALPYQHHPMGIGVSLHDRPETKYSAASRVPEQGLRHIIGQVRSNFVSIS